MREIVHHDSHSTVAAGAARSSGSTFYKFKLTLYRLV